MYKNRGQSKHLISIKLFQQFLSCDLRTFLLYCSFHQISLRRVAVENTYIGTLHLRVDKRPCTGGLFIKLGVVW